MSPAAMSAPTLPAIRCTVLRHWDSVFDFDSARFASWQVVHELENAASPAAIMRLSGAGDDDDGCRTVFCSVASRSEFESAVDCSTSACCARAAAVAPMHKPTTA